MEQIYLLNFNPNFNKNVKNIFITDIKIVSFYYAVNIFKLTR